VVRCDAVRTQPSSEMKGTINVDYSCFGLNDKVAIMTGASQGIGRAIALGFARAGAHLVLGKHPEGRHDEIRELQAEVEAMGRKHLSFSPTYRILLKFRL
jgi:hypothetical protein